jgi:hypothetical protein
MVSDRKQGRRPVTRFVCLIDLSCDGRRWYCLCRNRTDAPMNFGRPRQQERRSISRRSGMIPGRCPCLPSAAEFAAVSRKIRKAIRGLLIVAQKSLVISMPLAGGRLRHLAPNAFPGRANLAAACTKID